jgi:hypothetical protein
MADFSELDYPKVQSIQNVNLMQRFQESITYDKLNPGLDNAGE